MKKVLISCPTRNQLEKKINEYFYSECYIITDDLKIYNYKMDAFCDYHYSVRLSRGRWQFIIDTKDVRK